MTMTEEEHRQENAKTPEIKQWTWTMQIYTKRRLETILTRHGFDLVECFGPHESSFSETESKSILVVARKR